MVTNMFLDFPKTLYLSKFHFQNKKGNNMYRSPYRVISEYKRYICKFSNRVKFFPFLTKCGKKIHSK